MIRVHVAGQKRPTTWFGRLIQLILVAAVVTLGVMFSIVIIPTVILLGLLIWSYVWWKTRNLREQLKSAAQAATQAAGQPPPETPSTAQNSQNDGFIIEGEATRIDSGKTL